MNSFGFIKALYFIANLILSRSPIQILVDEIRFGRKQFFCLENTLAVEYLIIDITRDNCLFAIVEVHHVDFHLSSNINRWVLKIFGSGKSMVSTRILACQYLLLLYSLQMYNYRNGLLLVDVKQ